MGRLVKEARRRLIESEARTNEVRDAVSAPGVGPRVRLIRGEGPRALVRSARLRSLIGADRSPARRSLPDVCVPGLEAEAGSHRDLHSLYQLSGDGAP